MRPDKGKGLVEPVFSPKPTQALPAELQRGEFGSVRMKDIGRTLLA
jgi:hypothetical protein